MRKLHTLMAAILFLTISVVQGQSIESMMNTGQNFLANGAYLQATSQFRKVLAREPNNFEANHNMGFAYLALGRPGDAVGYLESAIGINQRSAETWANLAIAYENLGRSGKAMDALYRAVELDPDNIEARLNLATMYMNDNRVSSAIRQYKAVIQYDGARIEAYSNLAKALITQNKIEEAKKYLTQALAQDPQYAEAHWELGNIYWKSEGKPVEASEKYQMALRFEPEQTKYYENRALLLEEMGHSDSALSVWNDALVYITDGLERDQVRQQISRLEAQRNVAGDADPAVGTESGPNTDDLVKEVRGEENRPQVERLNTESIQIETDFSSFTTDTGEVESPFDFTFPE